MHKQIRYEGGIYTNWEEIRIKLAKKSEELPWQFGRDSWGTTHLHIKSGSQYYIEDAGKSIRCL